MKVLVLHSLPPSIIDDGRRTWEFDLSEAARGVAEVLPAAVVAGVRGEMREVIEHLSAHKPDVVFNAWEAPLGRPDWEAHVAALLEWSGVPFTGSGTETFALCRRTHDGKCVIRPGGGP